MIPECCSGLKSCQEVGGLGSGGREGRKGAQEGCISQSKLRKRKKDEGRKPPSGNGSRERGKEENTSLLSLRPPGSKG